MISQAWSKPPKNKARTSPIEVCEKFYVVCIRLQRLFSISAQKQVSIFKPNLITFLSDQAESRRGRCVQENTTSRWNEIMDVFGLIQNMVSLRLVEAGEKGEVVFHVVHLYIIHLLSGIMYISQCTLYTCTSSTFKVVHTFTSRTV